ncbi:MAG: T9SS type A sorting domain-containing protein [Bacteroidetes bacterium]|nr:T9SS type A sorting domain-containing protein [Bacteroidota bacterium]
MKRVNCFYQLSLLLLAAVFFNLDFANAQQRTQQPQKAKTTATPTTIVAPFEVTTDKAAFSGTVNNATYLQLDAVKLKSALKNEPREFVFEIPQKNGSKLQLLLEKQEILSDDFKLTDEKGKEINWEHGSYYTGRVLDRQHEEVSIAALSIVGGEIMANMTIAGDNFVLGTLRDGQNKSTSGYVLYNDHDLKIPNTFECGTEPGIHQLDNPNTKAGAKAAGAKNIVKVQFETDFRMFQDFGSAAAVSNYVTGLFNMVATIYHNENIVTQISSIVIWTTPDPYPLNAGSGSGDVLNAFVARKNITGINGNLAHLLSTKPLGHGGIAWIDVLCYWNIGQRTAYSNISTTYKNFPLYSWTIDVVTHEMGHNLGSPHTHDCVWGAGGNQALDNCYTPSGGCAPGPAPVNGGTIMSYCHLTSGGKNFNLGFGTQPGNLIRSKVNAAACLSKAWLDCAGATPIYCGVPVSGTTFGSLNNVNTYGCNSWFESGPEKVFMLQTTETGTITATLSGLSADLDVIILDACSESNCLAEGNNTAVIYNASPGMYFIVVDGYYGAQGNFTLSVNCSGVCFGNGLTNFEYIQRVDLGTIDNNSGNNYGYADFTNQKTPVQRGGTVDFTLTPGFISSAWNESWGIWIDINKDNDFNDFGEFVYSSPAASSAPVSGTLTVPFWAQLGETRMRVAMRFGSTPTACGTFYGEVEDYTVNIQPYCLSLGNTGYEFIKQVEVGGFTKYSSDNGGYADFTSPIALDLLSGETVPVTLTPGFKSGSYDEYWSIWIDGNQDNYFDATELVFSGGPSDLAVNGSFIVPEDALTGTTRMRISMKYGGEPEPCSQSFWGETEDYTVSITPFCPSAGSTTFEFIQTVGIGSLLNDSGNDGGYADFTDLYAEAAQNQPVAVVLVPGFTDGEYKENWRVWVDFNNNKTFGEDELVFEAGPSADLVFGTFDLPESLEAGKYGMRVSMRYGGFPQPCGNIGWGEVEDYVLTVIEGQIGGGDLGGGVGSRSNDGAPSNITVTGNFQLFPNPAKDVVNLAWEDMQPVAVQVVSLTGQVVMSFGETDIPTKIEVNNLPSGLYSMQVVTAENQVITKRFVKVD